MIVSTAEIESGFVDKDNLVPFRCSPVSSCVAPLQTEASMVREDPGAPSEGTTCAWMAAQLCAAIQAAQQCVWGQRTRMGHPRMTTPASSTYRIKQTFKKPTKCNRH
ncbi:hypothetical protein TNCV_1416121 [Trichonephila clavipes]|nr:hypothetical protein TNCV_1416121 [Trichonephila clavipes]